MQKKHVTNASRGFRIIWLLLVVALGGESGAAQPEHQSAGLEASVLAVEQQNSYPNLLVDASERFVAAGMAQLLDYTDRVRDRALGASITGEGHTTGDMDAELVADPRGATVQLRAAGHTDTEIVGRRRMVTVWADGSTTFVANKTLTLDKAGFTGAASSSHARSNNRPRGVSAPPLVRGMAWWYVQRNQSEGNQIAARRAEPLINDKLDEEAGEIIRSANDAYDREFRNPLLRCDAFPRQMDFSTTGDELSVVILQAAQGQIGAPRPAPEFELAHDIGIRMHETAFNNLAESLLGGQTMTDEEFRAKVSKFLTMASLEEYTPDEEEQPWSVTFVRKSPITVVFDNDAYSLVVSGERWTSGSRSFRTPMNVTVTYRINSSGGKVQLVRDQEVVIAPPGFVRGQGRLSTQVVSLRRVLQRKFDELFSPVIDPEELVVPGPWEKAGPLDVVSMSADSGWLKVSWEMQSAAAGNTTNGSVGVRPLVD